MIVYRKPKRTLRLVEWQGEDRRNSGLYLIDKLNQLTVIQFDYPEVNGRSVSKSKPRLAITLPKDIDIYGTRQGYINVVKSTTVPPYLNQEENLEIIEVPSGEIKGCSSYVYVAKLNFVRPDHICSIEPGTIVKRVGFLKDINLKYENSLASRIIRAVECFSGLREITIYRKDGKVEFGGRVPAKPVNVTNNNSYQPKREGLLTSKHISPIFEGIQSGYILAVELEPA